MASFNKKVEVLRALVRTVDQFEYEFGEEADKLTPYLQDIKYKEIDLQMMQEFKKVYSLGFNQLEKFVNELNEAAPTGKEKGKEQQKKIDVYSVIYFIRQLKYGPYGKAKKFLDQIEDIDIFKPAPDIMGNVDGESNSSTPVWAPGGLDLSNVTLFKSPTILVKLLGSGIANSQSMFNGNIQSAVVMDNTLPMIDKQNELRINEEGRDGRSSVNPAHGNHMVKDVEKIVLLKEATLKIYDSVKEFLGDKLNQIYLFNVTVNYFNPDINLAISIGNEERRGFNYMGQRFEEEEKPEKQNGVGQEILSFDKTHVLVDMFGQTSDSIERREFELNTKNNNGENAFELYTVKGQLGSGIDVKPEPMEDCSEN